ncbi:MAG: hypothetical protein JWP07_2857 [Pseudonocardiales bacterium]|nr:hypothetical protein [Pseudonocardiales bacterium]
MRSAGDTGAESGRADDMAHGTRFSEAELERMAERFTSGDVELVGEPEVIETDDSGGTAVMSVRLPRNVIAQLKALADQQDTGATVIARDFIVEGLAAQPGRMTGSIPAAEVLQLLTTHGFVAPKNAPAKVTESTAKKAPPRVAAKATPIKVAAKAVRAKPARKLVAASDKRGRRTK